ncbi:MAG: hypothetical protein ACFCUX_01865 [Candidatus Methylacidiphilales bacterium]
MKQSTWVCIMVVGWVLILADKSHTQEATAPPPPRPFKVTNTDGTVSTVVPDRGETQLMVEKNDVPTTQAPEPKPSFLTNSAPRETKTGYYAAAMLGANVDAFRGNDIQNWFGAGDLFQNQPTIFGAGDHNMTLGPMVALKFGYVWPFGERIDQFESETGGIRLAGALEGELVYLHGFHEINPPGNQARGEVQQITIAPMINFLLKGYFGRSEIYLGPGIGLANTFWVGHKGFREDESLADLAYQFILGYEYHMNSDWSIFTEAKYFTIQNTKYITEGDMSNVAVGIGVKRQL